MQGFEFTMQAAFRTFIFVGYTLLALTARKRISPSAEDDQMALPSGHPQAFREKGLT